MYQWIKMGSKKSVKGDPLRERWALVSSHYWLSEKLCLLAYANYHSERAEWPFYEYVDGFWGWKLNLSRSSTLKILCLYSYWGEKKGLIWLGCQSVALLAFFPYSRGLKGLFVCESEHRLQSDMTLYFAMKWSLTNFKQNFLQITNPAKTLSPT